MRQKISIKEIITPRKKILASDVFLTRKYEEIKNFNLINFPSHERYNNVIRSLPDNKSKEIMEIGKLVYVTGYSDRIFIYLGIAIEILINNVAELYIKNGWPTYKGFDYKDKIVDEALGKKQSCIVAYDLFGDSKTNNVISGKMQAITPLRNYSSHADKSSFLDVFFQTEANIVKEVDNCLDLMETIILATQNLIKNPPK